MSTERPALTVGEPRWTADGASVAVTLGERSFDLGFTARGAEGDGGDFALPATLLLAMAAAGELELRAPVSGRLLDQLPRVQDILSTWGPAWDAEFRRVPVRAPRAAPPARARAPGVACFFSGGVDSFTTLLAHREEITAIIFVHGFDIRLKDEDRRREAVRGVREVAGALGVELVEVEVGTRTHTDPLVHWQAYHGGVLAAIALLHQHRFHKVYIPATHDYADLLPWGTHPVLDHLWSTERLAFEHSGAGLTRVQKVGLLAGSDLAMRHLRVCWMSREARRNCGRCEKCVRTTINLAVNGALGRCETLPAELDPELVAAIHVRGINDVLFVRENRRALEARDEHPDVVEALRAAEARGQAASVEPLIAPVREERDMVLRDLDAAREAARHAEHRLRAFKATRRYRLAQALGDPLDRARRAAGRRSWTRPR